MSDMKSEKKGGIKTKIICKYFIQGKCTKGDSCPYLHSKVEKPKEIMQVECPMYNIGFCKNGRNCHFLHIKKDKYIEEKIDEKNNDLNIPFKEDEKNDIISENKEMEKEEEKNDNNSENKEKIKYPEIPIWYLEHYFDKPLTLIFSELEQKNLTEITELKKKYGFTNIQPNLPIFPGLNKKNKMNLNMNTLNLNFNNFNMNFAFNNSKTDNNKTNNNNIINSLLLNNIKIGPNNSDKKYDKYGSKKNSNEFLLNKQENLFYYLIRCNNLKEIEKSQETNTISLPSSLYEKYKNIDIQNMTIIIIICEEEFQNFSGFARLKTPSITEKKEDTSYNIEWLWRTKLSLSKVNHLMNKADNDNLLINGKNGCEVDKDLGFFCCRYMMKRLSKEEIKELTNEKMMFESEKKLLLKNLNNERYNQSNINSSKSLNKINDSNKDLNYGHKKYENNEINTPHKNMNKKNSEMAFTSSTRHSDYNKHDKYKEHLDYKDHNEHEYSGHKRHRDNSRSKSRSNRRDNSEDYSNYYKGNNKNYHYNDKYQKHNYNYHNGNNYHNSHNNKNYLNQRSYNYQKSKYDESKNDYSYKKHYK